MRENETERKRQRGAGTERKYLRVACIERDKENKTEIEDKIR